MWVGLKLTTLPQIFQKVLQSNNEPIQNYKLINNPVLNQLLKILFKSDNDFGGFILNSGFFFHSFKKKKKRIHFSVMLNYVWHMVVGRSLKVTALANTWATWHCVSVKINKCIQWHQDWDKKIVLLQLQSTIASIRPFLFFSFETRG